MPEAKTLFEFPARLMKRAPDETLLDLAKSQNAFDPSVFDEHRPFFFSAGHQQWRTRLLLHTDGDLEPPKLCG